MLYVFWTHGKETRDIKKTPSMSIEARIADAAYNKNINFTQKEFRVWVVTGCGWVGEKKEKRREERREY